MRTTAVATLVASLAALAAADVRAENLLQVYKEALTNDAQFLSARATLTAGREKTTQGLSGLLPQVAATGSRIRTDSDASYTGVGSSTKYDTTTYGVSLTQPLFRWANWEQYQQGKLQTAVSEAQFAQAQQDLILRVAQAYFDVLTAQDALESAQAQKAAISEQLASAKRNFEVGTATITDTHEAQARYDLTVAQELAAQSDLEIKRNALLQIIGRAPGNLADLRPGVELNPPSPAKIEDWVDSAEKQNYGVAAQALAREFARHEINRNRAGHAPTVDLVASRTHTDIGAGAFNTTGIGTNLITSASTLTNNTVVGVQVSVPIFSGFGTQSHVREAVALEEKSAADLETAKRNAAQSARQYYLGVTSGLAQVKALEAAEVSSQSALESNQLGYQVGVRINIDVLNAQQQLYSTRQSLAKARYDTLVSGLRLKAAAGTLKEEDLAVMNALLKP